MAFIISDSPIGPSSNVMFCPANSPRPKGFQIIIIYCMTKNIIKSSHLRSWNYQMFGNQLINKSTGRCRYTAFTLLKDRSTSSATGLCFSPQRFIHLSQGNSWVLSPVWHVTVRHNLKEVRLHRTGCSCIGERGSALSVVWAQTETSWC